jgi:hypothetical protein
MKILIFTMILILGSHAKIKNNSRMKTLTETKERNLIKQRNLTQTLKNLPRDLKEKQEQIAHDFEGKHTLYNNFSLPYST